MSEWTRTLSYSKKSGITFHPERDIAVMWTPTDAERIPTDTVIRGELNWYGDSMGEQYSVVDEW